jgi:hypothetical protein
LAAIRGPRVKVSCVKRVKQSRLISIARLWRPYAPVAPRVVFCARKDPRFYSEITAAAKTKTEARELTAKLIAHFNQLYEVATDPSKAIFFDNALLADVMYDQLDKTLPARALDEARSHQFRPIG